MLPNLKYQFILMLVLQFLDGGLTAAAIDKHGIEIEANPAIQWLMACTWPAMGLVISKTLTSIAGWFVYRKKALGGLMVVNYVYFIAVVVNLLVVVT